jgi:hypothetical protein
MRSLIQGSYNWNDGRNFRIGSSQLITAASTSAAANPEVKAFEHDPIAKAVSISTGTEDATLLTP